MSVCVQVQFFFYYICFTSAATMSAGRRTFPLDRTGIIVCRVHPKPKTARFDVCFSLGIVGVSLHVSHLCYYDVGCPLYISVGEDRNSQHGFHAENNFWCLG